MRESGGNGMAGSIIGSARQARNGDDAARVEIGPSISFTLTTCPVDLMIIHNSHWRQAGEPLAEEPAATRQAEYASSDWYSVEALRA